MVLYVWSTELITGRVIDRSIPRAHMYHKVTKPWPHTGSHGPVIVKRSPQPQPEPVLVPEQKPDDKAQ